MDGRFSLGLIALVTVAVIVGVLAAHTQRNTATPPAATVIPTLAPPPPDGWVYMEHQSSSSSYFNPPTLNVYVNQTVTFHNADTENHSALADNGAFNTGVLSPGENKEWVPRKPGSYTFGDFLHPEMHGVIIVHQPTPQ
ncbi:MAG TPA: cupredoxin domain-containing protein [Chloroflexota bacterium]